MGLILYGNTCIYIWAGGVDGALMEFYCIKKAV